jgi:hypothetical protein
MSCKLYNVKDTLQVLEVNPMRKMQYYVVRFGVSMLVYAVFIIASALSMHFLADNPLRFIVAALPVVPVMFGLVYMLRGMALADEMQQRINLEATLFSLAGTGLLTFGYGCLELAGMPPVSLIYVLPLMAVLFAFGQAFAGRRYQ